MKRRDILKALTLAGMAGSGGCSAAKRMSETDMDRYAATLHRDMLTLDSHVDIDLNPTDQLLGLGARLDARKVDLIKMHEGGVDGIFFAVWVAQRALTSRGYAEAYKLAMIYFNAIRLMCVRNNPDKIELALNTADVARIQSSGKCMAMIGVENGYPLGTDLSRVKQFYDLGARYITITHMGHNQLGDSSDARGDIPARRFGGLSEFGADVIREMNRLGMMVDVSHVSRDTYYDILGISKSPVLASHSGCRALCDVPRNMDDFQLKELARRDGVIQIVAYGGYISTPRTDADLSAYADHIDYAVNLIGIDHVGIGTDFDGGGGIPGLHDASDCPNITLELVRRGYSRQDIEKIWSGNLMRVWRANETLRKV